MAVLRAAFSTNSERKCQALGVFGTWWLRGHMPQRSRSRRLEAADQATEQVRFGAGSGESNAHPGRSFADPRGDLDQVHLQGFELGDSKRLRFGDGVAN